IAATSPAACNSRTGAARWRSGEHNTDAVKTTAPGGVGILRPVRTAAADAALENNSATLSGASEIDADRDVTARQFGKGSCVRVQLCECFVLCQCLLYLSVHFPTGIARRD